MTICDRRIRMVACSAEDDETGSKITLAVAIAIAAACSVVHQQAACCIETDAIGPKTGHDESLDVQRSHGLHIDAVIATDGVQIKPAKNDRGGGCVDCDGRSAHRR